MSAYPYTIKVDQRKNNNNSTVKINFHRGNLKFPLAEPEVLTVELF